MRQSLPQPPIARSSMRTALGTSDACAPESLHASPGWAGSPVNQFASAHSSSCEFSANKAQRAVDAVQAVQIGIQRVHENGVQQVTAKSLLALDKAHRLSGGLGSGFSSRVVMTRRRSAPR